MNPRSTDLTYAVLACLFAALISIGSYIAIPLPGTPVPIVLQNFFIMIAALILGPRWGLLSVGLYLFFGTIGLPVFSGGSGGLARLAGPTGGYLAGYIPAVILMGSISRIRKASIFMNILSLVLGMGIVYVLGVWRLKTVLDTTWMRGWATGALPFLAGDAAKIILASILAPRLKTAIAHLTSEESDA